MISQRLSPQLEAIIKPILALSPQEQLQVIIILLQTLFEKTDKTTPWSAKIAEPPPSRAYGLRKGEFVVPDDFDDPLPEDILDAFEGRFQPPSPLW